VSQVVELAADFGSPLISLVGGYIVWRNPSLSCRTLRAYRGTCPGSGNYWSRHTGRHSSYRARGHCTGCYLLILERLLLLPLYELSQVVENLIDLHLRALSVL
jgi:hypothetical protein